MTIGAYIGAALERECADVAATRSGRNDRLNRAAFALGQFVGSGALPRGDAEARLFAAAQACGYVATDGAVAARTTIRSGLDKGERAPREVPEGPSARDRLVTQNVMSDPRSLRAARPAVAEMICALSQEDQAKQLSAFGIWREAGDPRGTLVEAYFRSRGLELPPALAGFVLRYHPRCHWDRSTSPAMVALYRNIVTDAPVAIHRTALDADGRKIGRKMLGPVKGAAIKLDGNAEVTMGLAIGEGIETCQAARQIGFRPCWALGPWARSPPLPCCPVSMR
jgi:hypothetical protein